MDLVLLVGTPIVVEICPHDEYAARFDAEIEMRRVTHAGDEQQGTHHKRH